jgi:hypothetical protein
MQKAYGRSDMMKCIPIIWHEISRVKGRVDEVLCTLSNKRVKEEKLLEFKKQVVSNKSLKEYFKNHPIEKEVLQNDIQKHSYTDKSMFRHLDTLPFYAIPQEIMAVTPEQLEFCTAGSGAHVPEWIQANTQGNGSSGTIANSRKLESAISSFKIVYAEADESE